jgi:glycosyltransferase involved in cell wall biosynthesis
MRELLLLSYTFPPDNTAAAVRPGQLRDYLPPLGYRAHVIASSFGGERNAEELVRRVPDDDALPRSHVSSRRLHWLMRNFAPYDDRLPWVPYARDAAEGVIRTQPVAAIFSTSPFLASHFTALLLKMRHGLPWVADFQDPIVDNPFRTRRWFFPYDRIIERIIFRFADRLIANTDTVAAMWRARYPMFSGKISVLWNSFDPREQIVTVPRPQRAYRVLAHVGTLYGERHPARVLETLERLHAAIPDVVVKLVGPIDNTLRQRFQPLFDRLTQLGILEYGDRLVDRREALKETAEADYLLLLDLNASNASFQLPSKLLDYVRYGKPVLAYTPKNSPAERVLTDSGAAFVSIDSAESEASEDRKITEFLHMPIEPRSVSRKFEEMFSAEAQARTVARLFDELLEPK